MSVGQIRSLGAKRGGCQICPLFFEKTAQKTVDIPRRIWYDIRALQRQQVASSRNSCRGCIKQFDDLFAPEQYAPEFF